MARHRLAALALAAGAALLQACGGPQPTRDAATSGAAAPPAGSPAEPAIDARFVPAAMTAAPARGPPRAAPNLAGLTDGDLVAIMGEPDLKRSEDGAEAWLYRSPACVLDVFLETTQPGGPPRVVLATARPVGAVAVAEEACLGGLARADTTPRHPIQP